MLNKLLDRLIKHYKNKAHKKFGGELIMWVVYKPDQPIPNVIFNVHPDLRTMIVNEKCKELAEIVRQEWDKREVL